MGNRFVYIALALSLVILLLLGGIYVKQYKLQVQYTNDVAHTYEVINSLRECSQLLANAESSQRGYILTRIEHFKQPYEVIITKIDSTMGQLEGLISDNPSQRVNYKLLAPVVGERIRTLQKNLNLTGKETDFVARLQQGKLLMDRVHFYLRMMEKEEFALLNYRNQERNRYEELNYSFLKYTFIFACLICIFSILLIIRELRMRIRSQRMLEQSVFELQQAKEEIEQVSFAASHDLQEPLRKIRTLSTLITKKYSDRVGIEEKDILSRMDRSTERMHGLLENLIDFTNLINQTEKPAPVNLDESFRKAFHKVMAGLDVHLQMETILPSIQGYEQQLLLLFTQLLSNSLKYRHPDRDMVIRVSYELTMKQKSIVWQNKPARDYHRISIQDNGIGFENEFSEKIFQMFQRLHGQGEYGGRGVGLTIARRIMTNHHGLIEGSGNKGSGATFTLYFPLA